MASVEGLNLRGTRYYLRVLIPEDLQAAYGGRTRVNKSLGTSDRMTAVVMGLRIKAQWLEEFATKRQGLPSSQASSATTEALLIQDNGIHINRPTSPIEALRASIPPSPALTPISKSLTLWQLYEVWKKAEPRSRDTEQVYARTLGMAEKCLGTLPPLNRITRVHGNTFKAWLQDPVQGLSAKTAKNYLTSLQALLNFACMELEAIPRNPWKGLGIKVPKIITRRPWKDEELQTLFGQPLFKKYMLPAGTRSGGAAAYWIPLIGLFTGARIGELAQLKVQDITHEDGIPTIHITDTGDGQKLKTHASRRSIPIHPELIRLGLLDYVADTCATRPMNATHAVPPDSLWPELGTSAERQGNQISSWFSSYRKKVGLTDTYPDFHCLRHTVRTKLAQARVPEQLMDAITGHETGGSTGRKVYQHTQLADLYIAIQSLHYECIDLPQVYAPRFSKLPRSL